MVAWNERFALVNMPFAAGNRPAIGLEAVGAQLRSHGVLTRLFYENLAFLRAVGAANYSTVADLGPPHLLLGDWAFHAATFGAARTADEIDSVVDSWCMRYGLAARAYSGATPAVMAAQENAAAFVEKAADRVLDWQPGAVGIGASFQLLPAIALANAIRRRAPDLLVVLGGSQCHGGLGAAVCRRFPGVDLVCTGEGETFVDRLVECLRDHNAELATVPAIAYRNGEVVSVSPSGPSFDLDHAPAHDFSGWVDAVRAVPEINSDWLVIPFETSRGCWWGQKSHCIFCGLNADDLRFRVKSPSSALAGIRAALDWPTPHAAAVDNILANDYFESVLPEIARWRHGKNLFFEVKSNLTPAQTAILRAAGVREIQPGIESLATPLLRRLRKGVTAFHNVRLLRLAVESEIAVGWNLITYIPGETDADIDAVIAVARRLSHLQPPYGDSCVLTVDRFSPLFDEHARTIGKMIAPHGSYKALYGDDGMAADIATFFEYCDLTDFAAERTAELRGIIAAWASAFGSDALFWLGTDDAVVVYDFRGAPDEPALVTELFGRNVIACWRRLQDGIRVAELPVGVRGAWLDALIEHGVVLEIDGRLLSLAVRMDDVSLAPSADTATAQAGRAAYRARIERICARP
jgi:ribosomal peptide maturation radical SAM protein 1